MCELRRGHICRATEKPNWSSAVCVFQLFAYHFPVRFDFDITSGPLTYCDGHPAFVTAVRTHFYLAKRMTHCVCVELSFVLLQESSHGHRDRVSLSSVPLVGPVNKLQHDSVARHVQSNHQAEEQESIYAIPLCSLARSLSRALFKSAICVFSM